MTVPQQERIGQNLMIKLATLVILLAGIHAASTILVPFLLSLFIAIVLNPLVSWLMRHGLRRGISIALVMLVVLILFALIGAVLAGSGHEFSEIYPQLQTQIAHRMHWLQRLAAPFPLNVSTDALAQRLDPNTLVSMASTLLSQFSGVMSGFVLLLMTVIFMLLEVHHLPYKLRFALVNPRIRIAGLHRALKGVTHYLALKTLVSLCTGVAVWLSLWILGVQFAPLWGLVAFIFNFIPNIGPIIAGIPPLAQTLLLNTPLTAGLVALLFIAIHMVFGNMLEPRIMGKRLGLSSLVVFLSLIFWGWLLGPVGMLLSVPLTSVCKILMETTPGGSKLAILLGNGRP
ncbi:pheromone autoinducer 2 transporter [Erwinia sp. OLTSP20]|uniref:AI-2E family transporter n=1 Tax=unclassified Erwinia TaxID=2622719 RepID=UPI000C1761B6|nr:MULTISPECIES: AI-2E family transporter [unclassified Erwinia]PIJ51131.1 pheromone autoinducer 2 transporter [Erwinia sp. OAMSP11]PIJ73883.1 pheromone autoinducer 2 transporter [Erwinia sp. OLSSP12]PIJ78385.1 pheromone autoinducer 2 transporter [Erwinia sp. OLCASP19]PIJ86421.1 pheromone autoinducer 2 transporter [Erwinia sp. OLMTSP26]PIJ87900.1 pheromone autoinducer 2 transporter [Erwinia sp. OLMDSP33]